ncbi:MAG: lmo0937 family membrane protein [Candidatus Marinimicrobia bacterium]|nr:lmo0937 family membrane protein [Candidatus Neomarinimicrobiota bacterium]
MLYTIAIVLVVLWLLGFFAFPVAGSFIHILLVIGVIMVIWALVSGRRAA